MITHMSLCRGEEILTEQGEETVLFSHRPPSPNHYFNHLGTQEKFEFWLKKNILLLNFVKTSIQRHHQRLRKTTY